MTTDIMTLVLLAFGIIGTVEWGKGLLDAIKSKVGRSIVLSILSLVVSFACAVAASAWDLGKGLALTFVLLAFVQLGYQLIIQTVTGLIRKIIQPTGAPSGTA